MNITRLQRELEENIIEELSALLITPNSEKLVYGLACGLVDAIAYHYNTPYDEVLAKIVGMVIEHNEE